MSGFSDKLWQAVGDLIVKAVSNPYVVVTMLFALYNAIVDPTTKGIGDSARALTYSKPSK